MIIQKKLNLQTRPVSRRANQTRPVRKSYSHSIADEKKQRKKLMAEARAILRANRSALEQLAIIKSRIGMSKKETIRLLKTIRKET